MTKNNGQQNRLQRSVPKLSILIGFGMLEAM